MERSSLRPVQYLVPGIPAVAALLVNLWRVGTPSLWRDEAATLSATQRPLGDLLRMLAHIDAVHGAYYVFMHVVTAVLGTGVVAVRMPSVIAGAVAAGGTAMLGRRLADERTGLFAGLLVAASPLISRYSQEARQYSIATALAVVATCLLVRAVDRGDRRAFAAYAASIALVGWIHLFTLLLLPAHALALWTVRRERALLIKWSLAVIAGLAAVLPVALVALPQSGKQVEWIPKPDGEHIKALLDFMAGSHWLIVPMLILMALALWRPFDGPSRVDLRVAALAWAFAPPALLLGVSFIEPYYVLRYVVFCLPGVALLAAGGLRRIPLWGALPIAVVMLALAVPAHENIRKPSSRPDDLRALAAAVREQRAPGDAIVFHHKAYRRVMAAYPGAYRGLLDVALRKPAGQAADLQGSEVGRAALERRLEGVRRVLYVDNLLGFAQATTPGDRAKARLVTKSGAFKKAGHWSFKGGVLYLYVRR